ncbi:MAG: hypothetical protein JWQ09_4442 [Segetibacter sp.]|nr:hypothetical protein [Segetibacter sp.]
MMLLSIRCYHPSQHFFPDIQFFILSKGNNAGKPGSQPWVNSFVATANNEEMRNFYYWLTYGLHKAKAFNLVHRGSVIPFINIGETWGIIQPAANIIYPHWQQFKIILQQLELLEQRKNNLAQILKSTATVQEFLIRNYFIQNGVKS